MFELTKPTGLLISWATPAASKPTEAIFSDAVEMDVHVKQMEELAKVEKDDKYVCTTIKKTGSHFNTRRCITKEAKKREEENAKKTMEDLDRNWSLHGG